jgi:hypothetical protein
MATKQNVLGFIDAGREICRTPLVGMKFLHKRTVSPPDVLRSGSRLQAKDLMSLLLRHFAAAGRPLARTRITLRVFTPAGLPAVKISSE